MLACHRLGVHWALWLHLKEGRHQQKLSWLDWLVRNNHNLAGSKKNQTILVTHKYLMWMSAIVHKQNMFTKPYSTTHLIGLALNYQPNNIKLDTFINNTNSPSHILPFKMSCMLNQAVSVGELDHSRWLHICNRIPCPKEIKKLFTKINSCHTKQPPKTCQRGWAIKWCMHTHTHVYIYI